MNFSPRRQALIVCLMLLGPVEGKAAPLLREFYPWSRSFTASQVHDGYFYAVADTDEAVRVGYVDNSFPEWAAVGVMDFVPNLSGPFAIPEAELLAMGQVTEAPHLLLSGDYAFAIALFEAVPSQTGQQSQPGEMTSFIQVHIVGSDATIAQTGVNPYQQPDARASLAQTILDAGGLDQLAVNVDLWSGVSDYIELKPWTFVVNWQRGVSLPTRPGDYRQFAFPEPGSGCLATIAGIWTYACRRRQSDCGDCAATAA